MPDDTHECPHPICSARVGHAQLACAPHWHQLPAQLRQEIQAAYAEAPGSLRHVNAVSAALDWYHRVGQANG